MTPALHAIAQLMALRAVDSLIEGSVVGLFAAVLLRAARRQNAAARFAVSFSALMAIAVIPFLNGPSAAGSGAGHAAITVSESWALYLFAAWAVIAGFFSLRLVRALWHIHVLRQTCVPVDIKDLDPLLQVTLRRHAASREFVLCTSDDVRVPTAMGLWRPSIVIPRWILQELPAAELNQILLHEIAHLRRWDDWTNLAQQLVRAVFFFHPAVWWMEKRIALEREMACDDAVLAETPSPRAYAECLAHLAEKSFVRRSVALAQSALGKVRQTSLRVAQILNPQRPSSKTHHWMPAVSALAGFAIVVAIGSARAPKLIAFQDAAPGPIAVAAAPSNRTNAIMAADETTAPAVSAVLRSGPQAPVARVVQAKFKTEVVRHSLKVPALAVATHSSTSEPQTLSLVHLANDKAPSLPVIETMFVVIETQAPRGDDSQTAPQIYQIQMWRVLVLHPAVDPEVKPPQKQT